MASSSMSPRHVSENHDTLIAAVAQSPRRPSRQVSSPWTQIVRGESESIAAAAAAGPSSPQSKAQIEAIASVPVVGEDGDSEIVAIEASDDGSVNEVYKLDDEKNDLRSCINSQSNQRLFLTMKTTPTLLPESTVEYIASENLEPFPDPESSVKRLLEELASQDWIKVCESLNNTRRFAVYHSSLLLPILEKLIVVMVKAMKNPRSALCKTSIMTCSDIFIAFGEKLLDGPHLKSMDDLLLQLLMKVSQDKKFVCEEPDKALSTMVNSVARLPLLRKLQTYVRHSNTRAYYEDLLLSLIL